MMNIERIRTFRFLPLDTYPWAIALARRPIGQAILLALFALVMILGHRVLTPNGPPWWLTIAAGACAFAGQYRAWVLTLTTMTVAFVQPYWFAQYVYRSFPASIRLDQFATELHLSQVVAGEVTLRQVLAARMDIAFSLWPMLAAFFLFAVLAMYLVRRFRGILVTRHPIVSMLILFGAIVLFACSGLLNGTPQHMLWTFVAVFSAYFWFLCYALSDQRLKDGDKPVVQLGVFHPFWGGSSVPIGKGAAYLRKVEAKTPHDLAVTQIKGLKLIFWVQVLALFNYLLELSARSVRIPGLQDPIEVLVARHVLGQSYPWYICWANLIYSFFHGLLYVAIWSGPFVALARLAGYRLLRNTYRPLSSTTLAEFWNRYYFYFKELLVEMFFFPTFFRCFKKHKRMRLFVATIMAATVGNFIFHFIRDIKYSEELGFLQQLRGYQTYAFYCLVFGVGIGLSQMQTPADKSRHSSVRRRLFASVRVLIFYCILQIFGAAYSQFSLGDHFSYFFHIMGVA